MESRDLVSYGKTPVGDDVRRLKNAMTKDKTDAGEEKTTETSESRHLDSYKENSRSRRKEALT